MALGCQVSISGRWDRLLVYLGLDGRFKARTELLNCSDSVSLLPSSSINCFNRPASPRAVLSWHCLACFFKFDLLVGDACNCWFSMACAIKWLNISCVIVTLPVQAGGAKALDDSSSTTDWLLVLGAIFLLFADPTKFQFAVQLFLPYPRIGIVGPTSLPAPGFHRWIESS